MKKVSLFVMVLAAGFCLMFLAADLKSDSHEGKAAEWSVKATAIESCSCPMFCSCYFHTQPAGHHSHEGEKHYCKFNMAWKVDSGKFGDVDLTGARYWVAGDLGADYSQGETDWAVVTFDKSVSKAQRDALAVILGHVYPVKWKSFNVAEGVMDKWEANADMAHATLDGGKSAEIKLARRAASASGPGPIVIKNLQYWAAPRNEGFVLMGNETNAYRVGENAFETNGTNGFMITIDMNSKDVAAHSSGGM